MVRAVILLYLLSCVSARQVAGSVTIGERSPNGTNQTEKVSMNLASQEASLELLSSPQPPKSDLTAINLTQGANSSRDQVGRPLVQAVATGDQAMSRDKEERRLEQRLWVYPVYYEYAQCRALNYTLEPLRNCENRAAVLGFSLFVALLGMMIILGNSLIPFIVWKQADMKTKLNYIKASLAFIDMIAGFILLFSVLPNIIWFRNATEREAMEEIMKSFNSPKAIISASSLLFSLQGSLMHLMFLSAERFIAIKWPLWHRLRKTSSVIYILIGLWLMTLTSSFITAAFPGYYNYIYNPQVFMFTLGYNIREDSQVHGLLHFGFTLFLPYLTTIILTTLTGVVAFKELKSTNTNRRYSRGTYERSSRSKASIQSETDEAMKGDGAIPIEFELSKTMAFVRKLEKRFRLKPELSVLKTIIIMVAAFAAAWSIFFVIFFLSYGEYSKPNKTMSIMYLVSFYSGLSNSVANVIIYSIWDSRFREALVATFRPATICKKRAFWRS